METKISRAEKIRLYNELVSTHAGSILKGDTIPYTSHNGHMYSFLNKQDVFALKLPPTEITRFLTKYNTRLAENYGIVQKEFAEVPDGLLQNTNELKLYFEMSYEYVNSLKPKPTAKSKKKGMTLIRQKVLDRPFQR